ncbi:hypothetical protein SteCoe_13058 [Stentor coeruleus]|uniref:Uncharacterized protein n=1 Tax=Stentor coeruleus TaxID=5963 RepID=A0A1R2C998_9CILI|nr:hypothetical protein SteCoe_13058 [Stentor coeruleus]
MKAIKNTATSLQKTYLKKNEFSNSGKLSEIHSNQLHETNKNIDFKSRSSHSPCMSAKNIMINKPQDTIRFTKFSETVKKERILFKDVMPRYISPHRAAAKRNMPNFIFKFPRNDSVKLNKKFTDISIFMRSKEISLKNLDLIEDLKENSKLLKSVPEAKSRTWLENLNSLKENSHKNLTEDLKFCNSIFQDLIIRLISMGEKNESIMIDKLWRYVLHTFDQHLETLLKPSEKILITNEESEKITKIKTECQKKIKNFEKEIDNIKLDFNLTKNPLLGIVKEEKEKVFPYVDKIYKCLNELDILCKSKNYNGREGIKSFREENDKDKDKVNQKGSFLEGNETKIGKCYEIRFEAIDKINN